MMVSSLVADDCMVLFFSASARGQAMTSRRACTVLVGFVLTASPLLAGPENPALNKAEAKRFNVEFRDKPWKNVLEWLSEAAGLPVVAKSMPAGTFTLLPGPRKELTVTEIIDLLNDGLAANGFRLQPGTASIALLPLDERIDASLVPIVDLDDLPKRGRTEVVRVVVSLQSLKAEDIAPELKKLLSASGEVGTLAGRLVLTDTAHNVRQMLKTLRELDVQPRKRTNQER
jgi:type II secretory pathway component GspD/PulD (secretin)